MNLSVILAFFSGNPLLAISGGHIVLLLIVIVFLFGGKKIPELMGGIGKGMREFKKAVKDDEKAPVARKEHSEKASATEVKDAAADRKA